MVLVGREKKTFYSQQTYSFQNTLQIRQYFLLCLAELFHLRRSRKI